MRLESYKREQRNGVYLEENFRSSDFFLKTVITTYKLNTYLIII